MKNIDAQMHFPTHQPLTRAKNIHHKEGSNDLNMYPKKIKTVKKVRVRNLDGIKVKWWNFVGIRNPLPQLDG